MICNEGYKPGIWTGVVQIFFETATKAWRLCEREVGEGEGSGRQECSNLRSNFIDAMVPRDIFAGKINTL